MKSSFLQECAEEFRDDSASVAHSPKATALCNKPNTERLAVERRWIDATGQSVPYALTGKLLAGALAYEEQCRSEGGMTLQQQRILKRLVTVPGPSSKRTVNGSKDHNRKRSSDRLPFAIGTEFIREWQGRDHIVILTPDGLLWSGKIFSSLSAVARAITGTRWNGRRFFGVKQSEKRRR